ncbi:Hpt domain-containing protein [Bradyrhizobium commune]|uniref:Hpt domain-containing protein n=1 Tax=Bradyrhizobium commune TaxID=83627 RepID=A0A7S9D6L2_9BRAD|nr:Hpt domain-containing protein [Bradyrhizobium commune]QPF92152.1 Hpt domain-containing protein [Bradyrhizobium commune]
MFEATFATAPNALETDPTREPEPLREPEQLREPGAFDVLVREIGEDGAGEVRAVFWSETCARLELFGALALGEHRARIGREAHSLKSAARTFGYLRLASLAQQLERTVNALGEPEYCDLLARMDAAFTAARAQDPQR